MLSRGSQILSFSIWDSGTIICRSSKVTCFLDWIYVILLFIIVLWLRLRNPPWTRSVSQSDQSSTIQISCLEKGTVSLLSPKWKLSPSIRSHSIVFRIRLEVTTEISTNDDWKMKRWFKDDIFELYRSHWVLIFLIIVSGNKLTQLDFSQNYLATVPSNALRNLHHLLILNLNHNKINSLHAKAFEGLDTLEILTLYENEISSIEADAFKGLDKYDISI